MSGQISVQFPNNPLVQASGMYPSMGNGSSEDVQAAVPFEMTDFAGNNGFNYMVMPSKTLDEGDDPVVDQLSLFSNNPLMH